MPYFVTTSWLPFAHIVNTTKMRMRTDIQPTKAKSEKEHGGRTLLLILRSRTHHIDRLRGGSLEARLGPNGTLSIDSGGGIELRLHCRVLSSGVLLWVVLSLWGLLPWILLGKGLCRRDVWRLRLGGIGSVGGRPWIGRCGSLRLSLLVHHG